MCFESMDNGLIQKYNKHKKEGRKTMTKKPID